MAKIVRHSQYGCVSTVGISHECMSTKQFQDDRTRVAISPALSDEASEFLIDSWQSLNTVSGRSTELGILHDPAHDVSISDLPTNTFRLRGFSPHGYFPPTQKLVGPSRYAYASTKYHNFAVSNIAIYLEVQSHGPGTLHGSARMQW
jgi:hypothetical protein